MKKFGLMAAAVCALMASAAQAQVTLLDQIGPDASGVTGQAADASQRFEAGFGGMFDAAVGDNFVVSGGSVQLGHVKVVLTGFNTPTGVNPFTQVQNYAVEIYSSPTNAATNLVGNVSSTTYLPAQAALTMPFGNAASGLVDIDVTASNINLTPGTYWVAVVPRMDFATGGQFGVSLTTFGGGAGDGFQANPGGGFGIPGNLNAAAGNFAYAVTTAAVPEPTSMALVGIGLAGFGWRRFRKR